TRRCFEKIVKLVRDNPWGPPILWIVPKQATFEAERALTVELGAFARVRVYSFETFGEAVLAECGGAASSQVTVHGRQMILGWLLRQKADELNFFAGVAKQPGLARKLDATFVELEQRGKSPSDLEFAGEDLADQDDGLKRKVADLKKIYQAYLDYLGQDRLDPHRRLQEVLFRMENCKLLQRSHIFIDGFLDYRQYERQMIAGMAKACDEMEITVLADPAAKVFTDPHQLPDETRLFYRTENAYRQLYFTLAEQNVALDSPIKLGSPKRFSADGIAKIQRDFSSHTPIPTGEGVEFIEAENRRSEAMAAAARVRDLIAEGMRYRDIVILARNIGDYADLIEAAFVEHNIPCFIDRRRTVAHHPLLQLLRGVFAMLQHNWPHDAVMSMIKTGLVGLSDDEADELENYVLLHRIHSQAIWTSDESWAYRRTHMLDDEDEPIKAEDVEAARSADRLRRRAMAAIGQFARAMNIKTATVHERIKEIFNLFESLGVRTALEKWMNSAESAGDLEQLGEHEQVWNRMVDLLEEMANLLGQQPVSPEDFAEILDAGLESFDLALTPPTVDQVLVGQIDRTRSGSRRTTILLGLSEGQF
ncbi:MAG TPA: hypothetical protein VG722_07695, partial [Tepidisphaeraceae bacterium]|nr:hypothetical protein [Tepidisphaeraceae bacterium]